MKFTWQESDIVAGIYVLRPTARPDSLPYVSFKIGYNPALENDNKYILIAMTDGMILTNFSKKSLANFLNKGGYAPMSHKLLIESINKMRDWYN